ncbi:hypothetical protein GOP47_0000017 [Adiantum capillus-veneris]|uniref:Uncharacterized protein n=1 Tax=Adiantum capillus-veneris TaxID=13818 RepID=A0A9D4VCR4_ADICA|nr:hypothetical protein GOP47_0000017 [Adiantum capillus-veneris]
MEDEASFAKFYLRRFFTRAFQAIRGDSDNLLPSERFLKDLHCALILSQSSSLLADAPSHDCSSSHMDGLLVVSSIEKAKSMWSDLLKYGRNSPCTRNVLLKGIAISKKRCTYRDPTSEEKTYLKKFWNIPEQCFQCLEVKTYQKVLFKGDIFNVGANVIVKVDTNDATVEHRGHWKACITSLFSTQLDGKCMLFFGGWYYKQCIVGNGDSEQLLMDPVTQMSVLEKAPLTFTWDCVRPIYSILHKFIPLPIPRRQRLIAYEVKDLRQRDSLLMDGGCGNVPLWVEVHDIVQVCLNSEYAIQIQHAVVRETDYERKRAKLALLEQDAYQQNTYKVCREEHQWRSWDTCSIQIKDWTVTKQKKVIKPGQTARWIPIVWHSP